jgi:uncharacterized RDD family membrane protein YckC
MTGFINTATNPEPDLPAQPWSADAHSAESAAEEVAEEVAPNVPSAPEPDAWRSEVAERLARYRTRRKPRAPRYPSLLLPFDSSESRSRTPAAPASPSSTNIAPFDPSFPISHTAEYAEAPHAVPDPPMSTQTYPPEPAANVIEFPRSAAIPIFHNNSLADPIFDRPRIVEAPEVLPPPPALGGILIETAQDLPAGPRASLDSQIHSASIPRRLLATSLDIIILASALSAFVAIFERFNAIRGPLPLLGATAAVLAMLLWVAYQYLFIVYTGSTPGLLAARIKLTNFDGSPVPRRTRRWRVLASFLSGFSAGLGYLWCFLDQDSLCWHDRITRTYLQAIR